jgi:hypothetical protein
LCCSECCGRPWVCSRDLTTDVHSTAGIEREKGYHAKLSKQGKREEESRSEAKSTVVRIEGSGKPLSVRLLMSSTITTRVVAGTNWRRGRNGAKPLKPAAGPAIQRYRGCKANAQHGVSETNPHEPSRWSLLGRLIAKLSSAFHQLDWGKLALMQSQEQPAVVHKRLFV